MARGAEAPAGRVPDGYRWWPSKGALLAEAMAQRAEAAARLPDTGGLCSDLRRFLTDTCRAMAHPANRRMLRQLMASAQHDPHLAAAVADFTAQRRRELRTLLERGVQRHELAAPASLGTLVDLAYGFLWYRLLVGHEPLDEQAAEELTGALLAAGGR